MSAQPPVTFDASPNNLEPYFMPFTNNRRFKRDPLMVTAAKGMYYRAQDGRQILDGAAGLWCVNAGHGRERIVEAIQRAAAELDYAPTFQVAHPRPFQLASRLLSLVPDAFDHVFYCNSGSEAVDSALKIALAYHRIRGEGARTRLIGRERGYHGTGFGGISVGGIARNRMFWGPMLAGVDHLPHTHNLEANAFSRGEPEWGGHLADDLERIAQLHDPSTIAAVIVEPVAGSTGVLIPPKGYLKRLRQICDKYGFLLIFDEVITGFGRLGSAFATEHFGVVPDLITFAKGLTNGAVPMGGVFTRRGIYDAFIEWADRTNSPIELYHGYTYSGHPLASAAALATLEVYKEENLFARAAELAPYWEQALHGLRGMRHVIDIRNLGLVAGIELEPRADAPGARGYEAFLNCFERGVLIRVTGDIVAVSPPLIIERGEVDQLVGTLAEVLKRLD